MGQVSWQSIYENFKAVYPNLGRRAVHFCPAGYMTIQVSLTDGTKMVYDGQRKRTQIVV